jgi:transposase InsO family protein
MSHAMLLLHHLCHHMVSSPCQHIVSSLIHVILYSKEKSITITDQGCTKAVILLPCKEESRSKDVARLFLERAFPFTGLPTHIISDCDICFTSRMFQEICRQLDVKQNLSMAYHPQTDGQSKRMNQTLEATLHIYCNHQ